MDNVKVAEAVVNLQLLVIELQKINADSLTDPKVMSEQFHKILDTAARGWAWSLV
jgi:hypothetical protein